MTEQKKRPAVTATGRKTTTKVATTGNFSVSQAVRSCKRFMCLMGCLFSALATFLFFVAPFDPGEMSFTAGWSLAAVSGWLCRELYREANRE